ncbi:MAG: hypothetical protein H0T46_09185 [Deltaproteobacteria bacterium]|nr:hypothetical protein [Deltaproteobacteria bacterium]
MFAIRICVISLVLAALWAPARAESGDAVALLPLDADARLTIYGQPVASEIARALVQGGVEVVVVGPKMAVPDRAKLIVDGTISASKADVVTLTLRLRNRIDGTTVGPKIEATAQGLPNIDKAASELSAKILPIVKAQLAALNTPVLPEKPPVHVAVVAPDALQAMTLELTAPSSAEPLRAALADAVTPWVARNNYEVKTGGKLALTLEVKRYSVTNGKIPYATARVKVKVVDGGTKLFDRVVVTNSVLGDKDIALDALAKRTAREVLDILRPHLRRVIGAWR